MCVCLWVICCNVIGSIQAAVNTIYTICMCVCLWVIYCNVIGSIQAAVNTIYTICMCVCLWVQSVNSIIYVVYLFVCSGCANNSTG